MRKPGWRLGRPSAAQSYVLALILCLVCAIIGLYRSFVHDTESGWVGIEKNQVTGELALDHPGWNLNPPWVWVAMMDTRPQRVCISTTARAYECKLVQFETEAYQEFVVTEGWRYYWWSNRLSFNWGYDEEYRGVRDVLRGYAFSPKPYPFLTVIRDYGDVTP